MCWFSWMRLSFVTTLQDDSADSSMMWCVGFLGCYYLLLQLCKMITKDSSNCDVMCSAVGNSPPFWNESPFQTFTQNFNLTLWLTVLTNWLKWRFVQKRGRVADGWMCWVFWDATIFCNNFARWLQKIVATVMCCVGFLRCYYLLLQLCKVLGFLACYDLL